MVMGARARALAAWLWASGSDLARARARRLRRLPASASKGVINVGGAGLSPRPINRLRLAIRPRGTPITFARG